MELQFSKNACDCLRRAVWEIKTDELTQEVRLSDGMCDVGRVLGAWGQVLVRSKEWRGNGISISGGVMAWVLYAPEDGSAPASVETWMPFQMRWDIPESKRDGTIVVNCHVGSVDARAVSARKLMVRAVVSVAGEALEPWQLEIYSPGELPEDVHVLRKSYPVRIPKEAGEKTFLLDDELPLNAACEDPERIIRYELHPEIIEKKIMADKAVFRGAALMRALCLCRDGQLRTCDFEIPFSQYADLEREYGPNASVWVVPAVTSVELESQEDGGLHLKAGLIGQYVVYDRPTLEIVEDAYSPNRSVALQTQLLEVPAMLEERQETIKAEQTMEMEGTEIVDVSFSMEHPGQRRTDQGIRMELPGNFQLLCYDSDGNLQGGNAHWESTWELPAAPDTSLMSSCRMSGRTQAIPGAENAVVRCDVLVDMMTASNAGIPMVTALELGEMLQPDPGRPSLVLRRAGSDTLWDIAKQCGSTVEAISQANGLTEEPAEGQMLLIPVS